MADSNEDWIRQRAYELWEAEGYPTGKDAEHWEQAKLEYTALKPTGKGTAKSGRKTGGAAEMPAASKSSEKASVPTKLSASKPKKPEASKPEKTGSQATKMATPKVAASKAPPAKATSSKTSATAAPAAQEPGKKRTKKVAADS
jgi:hypothetical protein